MKVKGGTDPGRLPRVLESERFLGLPCGLGVRDDPRSDAIRDLGRRSLWHLGRMLAVPGDPIRSSRRLPHEFNAVRRPTA
jgi:hypothetical protein